MIDINGKEIQAGTRVRFATWGMLDVWVENKEKSGRQPTDPEYVTHTKLGTVDEVFDDGHLHIRPDGSSGVTMLCTKPSWDARPEFVEVIN